MKIKKIILNAIVASIMLCVLAIYAPNFNSNFTWLLVVGGFLIAALDFLLSIALGIHKTSYGKILVSTIVSILIIYSLQFLTEGFFIQLKLTLIGALTYAIISSIYYTSKQEGISK